MESQAFKIDPDDEIARETFLADLVSQAGVNVREAVRCQKAAGILDASGNLVDAELPASMQQGAPRRDLKE